MNISPNRTLICLQLTQEAPHTPGFIYNMNSLQDVFNYIKPSILVELINHLGECQMETYYFKELKDFDLFKITEQSEILNHLIPQLLNETGATSWDVNFNIEFIVRNSTNYDHPKTKAVKENLNKILAAIKTIEESYRTLDLYFLNRKTSTSGSVTIMNASLEQLNDLDDPMFLEAVDEELKNNYFRFDMSNCYSFLLLPGFLWPSVLNKCKKLTDSYNIQIFSDAYNERNFDNFITYFELDSFQPNAQLVLGANYITSREQYDFLDESEDDVPMIGCSALLLAGNSDLENLGNVALLIPHDYFAYGPNINYNLQQLTQVQKLNLNPLLYQQNKIISPGYLRAFCDCDFKLLSSAIHMRILNYVAKSVLNKLIEIVFKPEQPLFFLSTHLLGDNCNRAIHELLSYCSNYFTSISSYSIKQITDNHKFPWHSDHVDNSQLNFEVLLEFEDRKDGAIISLQYNIKEGICQITFSSIPKEIFADGICPEPLGNTLFVGNFSDEYNDLECVEKLNNLGDVFEHYRPMICLKQKLFNGAKEEWLRFDTISDFSFKSIIARSTILSSLEWLRNAFNSNMERLKGDTYFEQILSIPEIKMEYCTCLSLIQIMLKGEIDSKSFAAEFNKNVTKCGGFDFFKYSIDSDKIFTLANFNEINQFGFHLKRKSPIFKQLLLKIEYWEYLINQSRNFEELLLKYRLANIEISHDFEIQKQFAINESAELGKSYKALEFFLRNSQTSDLNGILVVSYKKDTAYPKILQLLKDTILRNNERLDIRKAIQFLVIPEWNWNKVSVRELANFLYPQNVILFTNVQRSNYSYLKTIENFKTFADFDRTDVCAANVCLSTDWLADCNDNFATFTPACCALAGKAKWDIFHPGVSSSYFLPEKFSNIISSFSDEDENIFESPVNSISLTLACNDVILKNPNTLYEGEIPALKNYNATLVLQRIQNIFAAKLPTEHLEATRIIELIKSIIKAYSLYIDEMSLIEYDSWKFVNSFSVNIKFKFIKQPIVLGVKISEGNFLRLAFDYK